MKPPSAGILLYRTSEAGLEVFLAHPGGPFFAKKDEGAWGIPKGRYEDGEDPLTAAYREFAEEIGCSVPEGDTIELKPAARKGDAPIYAWAVEDPTGTRFIRSNTFEMKWPPRTGKMMTIPEIDRAEWFTLDEARTKIRPGQLPFLDELETRFAAN